MSALFGLFGENKRKQKPAKQVQVKGEFAMTAQGLTLLSHDLPKTEGEPCGAREKRRCGVMTARQGDR